MKNKTGLAVLAIVGIAYIGFFLTTVPKIDPVQSRFSVACDNTATDAGSQRGFGEIPGKDVVVQDKSGSPRNWTYVINDMTWDVVSKVICNDATIVSGQNALGSAQILYQTVQNNQTNPEIVKAHAAPANYSVVMTSPVYVPSWGSYIAEVLGLVILLGIGFFVIK